VVLHGLEGSSRAAYVGGMLAASAARDWNGLALNFRTCGPTPARGTRLYHSGDTRDLPLVLARARKLWQTEAVGVVGFSMGGNILLKWLGEQSDDAPLAAAVAISVPFDLGACAAALDAGGLWPFIYRTRFLRTLRHKAARLAAAHPELLDTSAIRSCNTFGLFDQVVTAPLNGFADATDYWSRCSSAPWLPNVRRPTLIISSTDDPFVPTACIPRDGIAGNPNLSSWITERGGHVGFVAGTAWRPRYVVEEVALGFLAGALGA